MSDKNSKLFSEVKSLGLPLGEYAITGSGPMGARNMREVNDIDIVVSDKLWNSLEKKYGSLVEDDFRKIKIGEDIEILGEGSFLVSREPGEPTVADQISTADIINDLPFTSLNIVLFYKKKMNRPKDQADITAIEKLLATQEPQSN